MYLNAHGSVLFYQYGDLVEFKDKEQYYILGHGLHEDEKHPRAIDSHIMKYHVTKDNTFFNGTVDVPMVNPDNKQAYISKQPKFPYYNQEFEKRFAPQTKFIACDESVKLVESAETLWKKLAGKEAKV
jgi:hypothetical protein